MPTPRRTLDDPLFYAGNVFPDVPAWAGVYVARGAAVLTGFAGSGVVKANVVNPHATLLWRSTDIPEYWEAGAQLVGRVLGFGAGVHLMTAANARGADDLSVLLNQTALDESGAAVGVSGSILPTLWPCAQTSASDERKVAALMGEADPPILWGLTPDRNLSFSGRVGYAVTYNDLAVAVAKTNHLLVAALVVAVWVDDGTTGR